MKTEYYYTYGEDRTIYGPFTEEELLDDIASQYDSLEYDDVQVLKISGADFTVEEFLVDAIVRDCVLTTREARNA